MLETADHRSTSGSPSRSIADRRADATRDAIVEGAWDLSREQGLMGWSLRELARVVGLKAPTLYAYFDSKHAIYDAMFRQGFEAFDEMAAAWAPATSHLPPREGFKRAAREFAEACAADPVRYHLLFQRVVPDFEPSEEAYAASLRLYDRLREEMARAGITDEADLDLWTAILTGLTDQQISNDPGGDRWLRLVDTAVDLFCDHVGIPREGE